MLNLKVIITKFTNDKNKDEVLENPLIREQFNYLREHGWEIKEIEVK